MKTLKGQMMFLVVSVCLLFVAFIVITGFQSYNKIYDSRKNQLKTTVEIAFNIANGYKKLADEGKLTEEEAKREAISAIKNAKYGNNIGYFYIFNIDNGLTVMHPDHPEWDGEKRISEIQTSPGEYGIAKMSSALLRSTNNEAFVEINFPKPGSTEPAPKLQYLLKVDSWGWMIGSGIYILMI